MPKQFLQFSSFIDQLNDRFGVLASWLVLLAVLISAGNAIIRYSFSISSNAWLEIQWYLFTGMVMLGAATTFRLNEHVRVDVLYAMYPNRVRLWLDFWGGILFLLPMCLIIGWNSLDQTLGLAIHHQHRRQSTSRFLFHLDDVERPVARRSRFIVSNGLGQPRMAGPADYQQRDSHDAGSGAALAVTRKCRAGDARWPPG